jgi:putative nucleotidyltransferase with HDIG domain
MSIEPNLEEQAQFAETLQRPGTGLSAAERRTEVVVAAGFVAAAAGVWWLRPPASFAVWPAVVCLVVLALATRIRIDMPLGYTAPTQLAFVPLLFAMPLALVPGAVVVAWLIGLLPEVLGGTRKPSRLLMVIGNSWCVIGPVAVFALAGTAPRHAGAVLLLGALSVQFVVDLVVSTTRFAINRGAAVAAQLSDAWVYAIDAALASVGLIIAEDIHGHPVAVFAPLPLLALLRVLARERRQRLESMLELNNAYRGTALVLGDVVEADDEYTGIHCKSVVALSLTVGKALRLDAERMRNLEFAALLHDVGKIAIPKAIINKPASLDPDEWMLVKTHTVEGQRILDRVGGFMREVGVIVRSHHERWDGAGYPDRLAGDAIPLEARIIACCDSWNAMRTTRPYREALPQETAVAELSANAGRQFDPRIAAVLLAVVAAPHTDAPASAPARETQPQLSSNRPAGISVLSS